MWLSLGCLLAVMTLLAIISTEYFKRIVVWLVFSSLSLLTAFGFLKWAAFESKSIFRERDSPRFEFSVRTSEAWPNDTWLTNDFLSFRVGDRKTLPGALAVPVRYGSTNISLWFVLKNASSVIGKEIKVTVHLPQQWYLKYQDGWTTAERGVEYILTNSITGKLETNRTGILDYFLPKPVHPRDAWVLPKLLVSLPVNSQMNHIFLQSKAEAVAPSLIGFQVFFAEQTNSIDMAPIVFKQTNSTWRVGPNPN